MKKTMAICVDCGELVGPLEWSWHYQFDCKAKNETKAVKVERLAQQHLKFNTN